MSKKEYNNFLTECVTIDSLMGNGFPQGTTVAIYAESGRGKTIMSAQLALACIKNLGQDVIILETEGNREQDYLELLSRFKDRWGLTLDDIKSHLHFYSVISSFDNKSKAMVDLLNMVGYDVEIDASKKGDKYSLVFSECKPKLKTADLEKSGLLIVDSLTEPVKSTIGHKSQNLPARSELISRFFSRLISIATEYNLCAVINHHACHDETTMVLVRDKGIIPYTEVNIGDLVLGLDNNGKRIWTTVKNKYVYDYDGEMIRFKGKSIDLLMTPNHRFMEINNRYKNKSYELSMKYREASTLPKHGSFTLKSSYIFNEKFMEPSEIEYLSNKYPMEFLEGWYLAEGYLDKEELEGSKFGCRFCVNKNDLKWLIPTLDKLEITHWNSKEIDNEIQVGISRKSIYNHLTKFGRLSQGKSIPSNVIDEYNEEQLTSLLFGYLLGDGHKNYKQSNMFTTTSKRLCDSIVELCTKIGYSVTFNSDISNTKTLQRVTNPKDIVRWYGYIRPKPLAYGCPSKEKYIGKVWCLETETGNFMVVRNGKPCFSGNSINPLQMFGRDFGKPYGGDEVLYNSKYILCLVDSDMAARAKYGKSARRIFLLKHPFNPTVGELFPINLKPDYGYTDDE